MGEQRDLVPWMDQFRGRVEGAFGSRLRFLGLQGSRARGEGRDDSDYDVVVLLDRVSLADLETYRRAVADLPHRELLCGFVAGVEQVRKWSREDLFQFRYDTVAFYGRLEDYLPSLTREDIRRGLHMGACNCYHLCSHNYLHERSPELLRACYKGAVFVLQAKAFLKTGQYYATKTRLASALEGADLDILRTAGETDWKESHLPLRSQAMLDWAWETMEAAE